MSSAERIRNLLAVALIAPLAACSSIPDIPNPINAIPGLGNNDDDELNGVAPDEDRISIMSFEQGLQLDTDHDPVDLPTAYVNQVWPQPDGYPTHAVQHTQAGGSLDIAWRQSFGHGSNNDSRLIARPVIADGMIFTIDASGQVFAHDADNGSRIWSTRLDGPSRRDRMSFGGAVAYDNGRIYAHSGYNYFVALDAETGSEVWRTETLVPFHGAPTVADGRVFVTSDNNELIAINADDGMVLWTHPGIVETARLLTAPSPAVLGDLVVAPFASGELIALRVQNGNPIWSDSLSGSAGMTAMSEINDVAGSPVIMEDTVYAMSHSGILVAISLRTGERLWSQPAGGSHAPWVAGNYLFVTTNDAEVVCLDRRDGSVLWMTQLDLFKNAERRRNRIAWTGPVLAGGRVFVASSQGDAAILNAYDGELIREMSLGDNVFIEPVIANETVYVLTDEARLIALR
jgi:outer membrane protein assembly factor BamB